MRRNILGIVVVIAACLAMYGTAGAAGTVVETVAYQNHDSYGAQVRLQFVCTGDASDGSVPSTAVANLALLQGSYIYTVETVPDSGAQEPSAYTLDLVDANGQSVVDLTARSATVPETEPAHGELGIFPLVTGPLNLVVGNLGTGNGTTIYVTCVK